MTIICAALVVALLVQQFLHDRANDRREKEWSLERTGLLTRIQHPEIVVGQAETTVVPDEELRDLEQDDIDLVGTVQLNGDSNTD